jgi:hypothetical protein
MVMPALQHQIFLFDRRLKVLTRELAAYIKPGTKNILHIRNGDGSINKFIRDGRNRYYIHFRFI